MSARPTCPGHHDGPRGHVRDIAALIAFLLGQDAGYITAATYDINGGLQVS